MIEIYWLGTFHFTKVNIVTFTKLKKPSYTRRRLLIYFLSQGKSSGLLPQWDVLAICCQVWPLGPSQEEMVVSLMLCQLQTGTCQGHLPSASVEIEPCATVAIDLRYALKGVRGED